MHSRRHLTLALCTVLHACTHAFQIALVPLYLLMCEDLGLSRVKMATLIVTVYGGVYCLLSYPAGILADRLNRKAMLGIGLIGNAVAIGLMGVADQYWMLVALAILAGMFGTIFHPAANALASAHYPKNPGSALGLMGIGTGVGFFFGAQYSGWRAQNPGDWWPAAGWQVPCIEMGLAGILIGVLFLLLAAEVPHEKQARRAGVPLGPGMRRKAVAIALVLGLRDFAGMATISLLSIYLQKAQSFSVKQTGWLIGLMGLVSVVVTPVGVHATSGRWRLPGLAAVMILGGLTLMLIPHTPMKWLVVVLAVFQVFHLGSYAISEVSVVERVAPMMRGRVIGVYITIAGTLGSAAPWVIGYATDRMGERAGQAPNYVALFTALGALMMVASLGVRLVPALLQGPVGRVKPSAVRTQGRPHAA